MGKVTAQLLVAGSLLLAVPALAAAEGSGGATPPPPGSDSSGGAGFGTVVIPEETERQAPARPRPPARKRKRRIASKKRPARRAPARRKAPAPRRNHVFPVAGPYSFGGPDARFGVPRPGHKHQGQDIVAAQGVPVVSPFRGTVKTVQYQAAGAGHYVVIDGAGEERDYVFMHLSTGSITVEEGETVRTGQQIGQVGSTGRSSGPHLHFEIWDGAGWYTGGDPIDPLPLLRRWAS